MRRAVFACGVLGLILALAFGACTQHRTVIQSSNTPPVESTTVDLAQYIYVDTTRRLRLGRTCGLSL